MIQLYAVKCCICFILENKKIVWNLKGLLTVLCSRHVFSEIKWKLNVFRTWFSQGIISFCVRGVWQWTVMNNYLDNHSLVVMVLLERIKFIGVAGELVWFWRALERYSSFQLGCSSPKEPSAPQSRLKQRVRFDLNWKGLRFIQEQELLWWSITVMTLVHVVHVGEATCTSSSKLDGLVTPACVQEAIPLFFSNLMVQFPVNWMSRHFLAKEDLKYVFIYIFLNDGRPFFVRKGWLCI